eukprot:1157770-Pelagomonas_calceolata.AAC.12
MHNKQLKDCIGMCEVRSEKGRCPGWGRGDKYLRARVLVHQVALRAAGVADGDSGAPCLRL